MKTEVDWTLPIDQIVTMHQHEVLICLLLLELNVSVPALRERVVVDALTRLAVP